jgi:hypothetical protein
LRASAAERHALSLNAILEGSVVRRGGGSSAGSGGAAEAAGESANGRTLEHPGDGNLAFELLLQTGANRDEQ